MSGPLRGCKLFRDHPGNPRQHLPFIFTCTSSRDVRSGCCLHGSSVKPGSDSWCSHSSSALWLEGKGGTGVQYTLEGSAFARPPAALESKEGCQGSDYLQPMRCEGLFNLCLQHAGAALAAGLGREGGELWPPQELWEAAISPGPCLVPRELMQARHPGLPPACSGVGGASRAGLDPREPSQ